MSTHAFESQRKKSFRRPHPISLPTTTQAGERCRFAAQIHPALQQATAAPTYAVPSKLRQCHWSNTLAPTPLTFFELAGVGVVVSRMAVMAISATGTCLALPYTQHCDTWESQWIRRGRWCHPRTCIHWGHTGWRADRRLAKGGVPSFVRIPCRSIRRHRDRFPIQRRPAVLNANTVWNDNETLTAPTSINSADGFHRKLGREVAKERGSKVKGWRSGIGVAGGPTVESMERTRTREQQLGQEVGCFAGRKNKKWRQERW